MNKIKQNKDVLFYYHESKKWLLKIKKGTKFHTHIGIIDHNEVIGKEYGTSIKTNKGKQIYLLLPTVYDYIMKSSRGTQIVYPKDLGYIAARTGLQSGNKVIEVGTGSGSLTTFLAAIVKSRGHVFTFDVEPKFIEIAKENVKRAGMSKYVTFNEADVTKAGSVAKLDEVDVVVADVGDPWNVISAIRKFLKNSGFFVAICPTVNQLEKLAVELSKKGFVDIECSEQLNRIIEGREGKTRHSFRAIGHTTYLVVARKLMQKPSSSPSSKSGLQHKKKNSSP